MHELSIARALITAVERHVPPTVTSVQSVRVAVGAATGIVPSALELAFRAAAADTALRGARLILERVPAHSRCGDCARDYAFDDLLGVCPHCGGLGGELLDGGAIELRSIEVHDV
jgi:hydrogenase nickel incorporation protein HypA/HybF